MGCLQLHLAQSPCRLNDSGEDHGELFVWAPKPANLSFNSLICSCQLSLTSLSSTREKPGRLCCAFLPQVHGKSASRIECCPSCGQKAAACRCCVQAVKKASDGKRGALRGAARPQPAQLVSFRTSAVSEMQTRQRGSPALPQSLTDNPVLLCSKLDGKPELARLAHIQKSSDHTAPATIDRENQKPPTGNTGWGSQLVHLPVCSVLML